jgi:hypothetical protein
MPEEKKGIPENGRHVQFICWVLYQFNLFHYQRLRKIKGVGCVNCYNLTFTIFRIKQYGKHQQTQPDIFEFYGVGYFTGIQFFAAGTGDAFRYF